MLNRIRIRRALISGITTALIAAAPAAASRELSAPCNAAGAEKVFAPFGDNRDYVAVQDGGFEAEGVGWTLSPGATVVDENESYYLGETTDTKSLKLEDGASAVSAPTCVGLDTPKFRLVHRGPDSSEARLKVEVIYLEVERKTSRVAGELRSDGTWAPSPRLSVGVNKAGDDNANGLGTVAFRVTAVGGSYSVDDVYLDPRMRR